MTGSTQSTDLFPVRLRSAREKRDLSQGELAKRADLQPSAVSQFETGSRKPSFDNIRRLANALRVSTDYLLGRVSEEEALAGVDTLFRHLDQLTSDDLDTAEDFLVFLAEKGRKRRSDQ